MLRDKGTSIPEESKAEKPQYNGVKAKAAPPNGAFPYFRPVFQRIFGANYTTIIRCEFGTVE
jgi:hypothetical protein